MVYFVFLHFRRHRLKNCVTFVCTEKWVKNEEIFSARLCDKGVAIKTNILLTEANVLPLSVFLGGCFLVFFCFFFLFLCVTSMNEND